jgi:hypothetical protein
MDAEVVYHGAQVRGRGTGSSPNVDRTRHLIDRTWKGRMHRSLLHRWCAALLAVPLVVGCGDDPIAPFDPSRDLRLRMVNASVAAGGNAEFLLDGQSAGLLAYGQSTPYFQATGGTRTITMRDEPTDDGLPGPTLFTAQVPLTAGQFQTVFVTGSGSELAAITTTELSDAPADNFRLRVVHAGTTTPALDLYVTEEGADISAAAPLVGGIDPREVTDYQVIPFGSYQLRLTAAGTKDVLISSNQITFLDGQVTSLVVLDNPTAGEPPAGFIVPDGGDLDP